MFSKILFFGAVIYLKLVNAALPVVTEFLSVPTTVKARENNSVLLPCYLNTGSDGGKSFSQYAIIILSQKFELTEPVM